MMEELNITELINKIKKVKDEKKITTKELSDKTNISQRTLDGYFLSKEEYKRTRPSISNVYKIARVLGVSLDYLVGLNSADNFMNEEKVTAESLFKCLYFIIENLNFKIELNHENATSSLILKNKSVYLFLLDIQKAVGMSIDEILSHFDSCELHNKQIMTHNEYQALLVEEDNNIQKKHTYIYRDKMYDENGQYLEDAEEIISLRNFIWEEFYNEDIEILSVIESNILKNYCSNGNYERSKIIEKKQDIIKMAKQEMNMRNAGDNQ